MLDLALSLIRKKDKTTLEFGIILSLNANHMPVSSTATAKSTSTSFKSGIGKLLYLKLRFLVGVWYGLFRRIRNNLLFNANNLCK